jgi:hypothetical protein
MAIVVPRFLADILLGLLVAGLLAPFTLIVLPENRQGLAALLVLGALCVGGVLALRVLLRRRGARISAAGR